ncbi:MAG: hypothetical protein WA948_09400, partial [Pontixanthobacter sp.]
MKPSSLLLCSSLFALQPIMAAPVLAQDSDREVAESEAPENDVIAPQPDMDPVVPVDETAEGTLPADAEADDDAWDITAPPGA